MLFIRTILPILFVLLFYGILAVALIYFIIKRVKDKGKENFEKRDN